MRTFDPKVAIHMHRHTLCASARVLAALTLVAAARPTSAEEYRRGDRFDSTLLWNGFRYKWEEHPHRLSWLESRFSVDSVDRRTGDLIGRHAFGVKIGSFPQDEARYTARYHAVRSTRVAFGRMTVGPVRLTTTIDRAAEVEVAVSADLASTGARGDFGEDPEIHVLLGGFEIESTTHGSGWHFRGLGIAAKHARYDARTRRVEFDLWARVHPSNSPDPANGVDAFGGAKGALEAARYFFAGGHRYLGDWPANEPCEYSLAVDVVIVVGERGRLPSAARSVSTASPGRTLAARETREITIELPAAAREATSAFLGTTGFLVRLDDSWTARKGRYIRELGIEADRFRLDPADRSRASFRVRHTFSNANEMPGNFGAYRFRMTGWSRHVVLALDDPTAASAEGTVAGRLGSGGEALREILFGAVKK